MWAFFTGLRPLADSVCARTFLYLCPVLKPAKMQDSRAQTNSVRTNAGLTRTNGHSAPDSAVSTHNYAPIIVGRILQTRRYMQKGSSAVCMLFRSEAFPLLVFKTVIE
jgi:hypothetical protein